MKLYGCFILLLLVLSTEAFSRYADNDDDDSQEESDNFARRSRDRFNANNRMILRSKTADAVFGSTSTNDKKEADDTNLTIKDPIRIAIFNSGSYDVSVMVNYIAGGEQREAKIHTDIKNGEERSVFIANQATYIRIRIDQVGILSKKDIMDIQTHVLTGAKDICLLLAGTSSNPVYGICPGTTNAYADMHKAWTSKK